MVVTFRANVDIVVTCPNRSSSASVVATLTPPISNGTPEATNVPKITTSSASATGKVNFSTCARSWVERCSISAYTTGAPVTIGCSRRVCRCAYSSRSTASVRSSGAVKLSTA